MKPMAGPNWTFCQPALASSSVRRPSVRLDQGDRRRGVFRRRAQQRRLAGGQGRCRGAGRENGSERLDLGGIAHFTVQGGGVHPAATFQHRCLDDRGGVLRHRHDVVGQLDPRFRIFRANQVPTEQRPFPEVAGALAVGRGQGDLLALREDSVARSHARRAARKVRRGHRDLRLRADAADVPALAATAAQAWDSTRQRKINALIRGLCCGWQWRAEADADGVVGPGGRGGQLLLHVVVRGLQQKVEQVQRGQRRRIHLQRPAAEVEGPRPLPRPVGAYQVEVFVMAHRALDTGAQRHDHVAGGGQGLAGRFELQLGAFKADRACALLLRQNEADAQGVDGHRFASVQPVQQRRRLGVGHAELQRRPPECC